MKILWEDIRPSMRSKFVLGSGTTDRLIQQMTEYQVLKQKLDKLAKR